MDSFVFLSRTNHKIVVSRFTMHGEPKWLVSDITHPVLHVFEGTQLSDALSYAIGYGDVNPEFIHNYCKALKSSHKPGAVEAAEMVKAASTNRVTTPTV